MSSRETITLYPIGTYWIGRGLLYLALLLGPVALADWLGRQVPAASQSVVKTVLDVAVLPALYGGLYLLLRRTGVRAQNFIYLVILLFGVMAASAWYKAVTLGVPQQWGVAALATLYVAGFSWLVWRSGRAEQRAAMRFHHAAREEEIEIRAQAILRAQEIERQRRNGAA